MEAKTIRFDFNPDLFNDLYWHLDELFRDEKVRYIFLPGGSSASKTYTFVQKQIVSMLEGSDENALIMRKYASDIRDSIFSDFKGIINDWGLNDYFKIQINYIECTLTGSYCRFRGLDDSEKVKGISKFKRVVLEEISQFEHEDLKQIRKRLRGRKGQQIIGIFNPISEEHWLKVNVFDTEELIEQPITTNITGHWINKKGNFVVIKTTYLNNYYIVGKWKDGKLIGGFVDQHTIDDFEKDKLTDNAYYQVYGLGNWGRLRTGGEFWKDFNPNLHVRKVYWHEDLPLHIGFDENVNPYMTCLVWQIYGKKATQIDEICLPDPLNRRHHVCNEFKKRYPQQRVQGLYIYGDRTSKKEDTAKEKGENFFTDIQRYLSDYRPTLRLQNVNPSVKMSGDFINSSYAVRTDIEITIGDNCKKSIYDYQYALEDSDGTIKKTKKTNPITKVTYEEFGHCFVGETMVTTSLGEKRIDEINIGDAVLTRKGYKKVTKVFNNGLKKVKTYSFGENKITCTENHNIFTKEKGFQEVEKIWTNLATNPVTLCIFDEKTNLWKETLFTTTGLNSRDTRMQKLEASGFIIREGLVMTRKLGFMCTSIFVKLAKYQKGLLFITKMAIRQITKHQTCFSKKEGSTQATTCLPKNQSKEALVFCRYTQDQRQANGMALKMVSIGIKNMREALFSTMKKKLKLALIALLNLRQRLSIKSIAHKNVIINTRLEDGELRIVYDIQVEDEHEYFANNILVHNCSDVKRYIITQAFANEYQAYLRGGKRVAPTTGKNYSKNSY